MLIKCGNIKCLKSEINMLLHEMDQVCFPFIFYNVLNHFCVLYHTFYTDTCSAMHHQLKQIEIRNNSMNCLLKKMIMQM